MACTCEKCFNNPQHSGRDIHELVRRVLPLLDEDGLALCLCQLGERWLTDHSDSQLCAVADLKETKLLEARSALTEFNVERSRTVLSSLHSLVCRHSSNEVTRERLLANFCRLLYGAPLRCEQLELGIAIGERNYSLTIGGHGGYAALFEVLIWGSYKHTPKHVDTIVDLGAHVGVSSLYLHSVYPDAGLICVEPAHANLRYLRHNLASNPSIQARILPVAVSGSNREIALGVGGDSSSMINSAKFGPYNKYDHVSTCRLRDVAPSAPYGIKMDIEGSEFDLAFDMDVIANADWVMGEFHYGMFSNPQDVWLRNTLRETFALTVAPPRIECHGSGLVITQNFQALPKSSSAGDAQLPHLVSKSSAPSNFRTNHIARSIH